MSVDYTVTRLIESMERRAGFPARQGLYTDDDMIAFLNEAMYQDIVPSMMEVREEYFVDSIDYDVVANQARYAIPPNAIGQKVRSIEFYDPTGNADDNFYTLPQVSIEDIGAFPAYNNYGGGNSGSYFQYYLEANNIVLYPTPRQSFGADTQLRVKFFRRPNELVDATSGGGTIDVIDTNNNIITLSLVPSTWTTATVIDVVKGSQPFNIVGDGLTITNVSGSDLTVSSVEGLSLGDSVSEQGFTIIPNLPFEAHRLLEGAGVMRLLEGADDESGLSRAAQMYQEQKARFLNTLSPRSDSGRKKVVTRNDVMHHVRSRRGY